jgi:hypothetical protein
MSYLSQDEADRIITTQELARLGPIVENEDLAIRCNHGSKYTGGDGFNLESDNYNTNIKYATALYASICFAQDTIRPDIDGTKIDEYRLLLMEKCALSSGESYTYNQGSEAYTTLPKCHGLGGDAEVVSSWSMNDSAITLSRQVVEQILSI